MDKKGAIEHLDRVVRSIEEAVWLIDISSQSNQPSQLSETFKERIGEMLIEHFKSAIEDIEYVKYLLKDSGDTHTRDCHYNALVDEFGMPQSKA